MKFDNEDAYNLARDFLHNHGGSLNEQSYFSKFIDTYEKFDAWLNTENPAESARQSRKPFKINDESIN